MFRFLFIFFLVQLGGCQLEWKCPEDLSSAPLSSPGSYSGYSAEFLAECAETAELAELADVVASNSADAGVPIQLQDKMVPRPGSNTESEAAASSSSPSTAEYGGPAEFKLPLPPGYNWEVTQSWHDHCEACNQKGYGAIFGDYCLLTHSHSCEHWCKYAWDFNLPGNADLGVPVVASAEGLVKEIGYSGGWGRYVLLDHGNGICSRSAHLVDDSASHLSVDQFVCQGLQIGEIGGTPNFSPHLHFQFEDCSSHQPLPMGFSDGNGVPKCNMGADVYSDAGNYDFLLLTNEIKEDCSGEAEAFLAEAEPWSTGICGEKLGGCPLNKGCGRDFGFEFSDTGLMPDGLADAAAYLWSECALDGKLDGKLHPFDFITRAEALKMSLFLFDMMEDCGYETGFEDVSQEDWYFPVVSCGVKHGIINEFASFFSANAEVSFAEAAKMAVEAALQSGWTQVSEPEEGHFKSISKSHWGYKYVETLYSYGGVMEMSFLYTADQKVTRMEFIKMLSALSPCFCGNVECLGNCPCMQGHYSCGLAEATLPPEDLDVDVEPEEPAEPEEPEEPSEPEFPDYVYNLFSINEDLKLGIDCFVEASQKDCVAGKALLPVRCTFINLGVAAFELSSVKMKTSGPNCTVSDSELMEQAEVVESGKELTPDGQFVLQCGTKPDPVDWLSVSFDVGSVSNALSDEIKLHENFFKDCPFDCNQLPNGQFTVNFESPGGWYDGYSSGVIAPGTYFKQNALPADGKVTLNFPCAEIPVLVNFYGGPAYSEIHTGNPNAPFSYWYKYTGPPNFIPLIEPSGESSGISTASPYPKYSIVFPALE